MAKQIIVNVIPEEIRMATAEDGLLLEVVVERTESSYMVGNIYKGRVENVLPGMQAAFINIGIGKNAFLYAGDIFPHKSFQRLVAEDNLTVGAEIMIEIVKDAMGSKGPRATTHFSIPGRYVVVMPSDNYVGVSRRIESLEERSRLRALAEKIRPQGMGVIVRTVAEGHSEEELTRDFQYLSNLWSALTVKAQKAKAPLLLYRDADLAVRIIRDHVRDDIDEVIVDNAETYERMQELAKYLSPDLVKKIHLYRGKTDIFTHYGLEDEWGRLADRRVDLKCGGYLIIDKTEALTVIDVNTGRFIGHSNLADTVFRTNMEAAAEIARQLRLRDVGGIIVADFIDMQKESQKKAILAELESKLKADTTKTNVLGLTELGLVEMTRKKTRQTYESTLYEPCPCCGGRGIVQSPETLIIGIRRQLRRLAAKRPGASLVVQLHPRIAEKFGDAKMVGQLARELGAELTVESVPSLQPEVYSIIENGKVLVRSEESSKVRKPSPRRVREEAVYDGQALADPLSPEEMAPLLAENFVMEVPQDPKPTLEMRLAAMVDSFWEPVFEPDDWDEEVSSPGTPAEDSAAELPETEEKKPRRRRRSKKPAKPAAVEVAAVSEETPAVLENAEKTPEQENSEEPKKKKSRRRRKKKKPTDKPAEPEAGDETEIPEQPAASEEAVAVVAGSEPETVDLVPEVKKSRRRRRRKKKAVAAEIAEEAVESETSVPEAIVEEKAAEPDKTEAVKPKRRRRKKNPAAVKETAPAEVEAPLPAPQPAVAEAAPVTETAAADKPKSRRRKKKPVTVEDAPLAEVTAPAIEVVAAETEAAAEVKPKRRRRSQKVQEDQAAATEKLSAESTALVSAEALPGTETAAEKKTVKKTRKRSPSTKKTKTETENGATAPVEERSEPD